MSYNSIVISSGHGLHVRGAHGIIDEVDEARTVVDRVTDILKHRGIDTIAYHDNVSYTQQDNLNRIVDFHNSKIRDLDISVHFNAYEQVEKPMGVEVLYVTQGSLAGEISEAISLAGGLINRGAKYRSDLFFLNNTSMPSVLLEICFVDSEADCLCYRDFFGDICEAIAASICDIGDLPSLPDIPPPDAQSTIGKVSWFGGPEDEGVSGSEGLAFINDIMDAPYLFLPYQPEGTTGLARRLNPFTSYIAMRWDYETHPKNTLLEKVALVRNIKTGIALKATPADWGPNENTGRIADISPSLMENLGLSTDDQVEVIFPYNGEEI
jgi:hypothetical protein